MDMQLAELTEDLDIPAGDPVLPVSEMTPEVQLLARAVQLLQTQVQQRSTKRVHFPALPHPRTARQILADRRRQEARVRTAGRIAEAQARWAREHGEDPAQDSASG